MKARSLFVWRNGKYMGMWTGIGTDRDAIDCMMMLFGSEGVWEVDSNPP